MEELRLAEKIIRRKYKGLTDDVRKNIMIRIVENDRLWKTIELEIVDEIKKGINK